MSLAERIVLMKDGWIQQIGTPLDLYNHPVNMFSAGFLGSPAMNILEGKIEQNHGWRVKELGTGVSFPVPKSCVSRISYFGEKKVLIGIRPEHLHVKKGKKNPRDIQLKGTVEVVEQMGNETYLHLTVQKNNRHLIARIDADTETAVGSAISLSPDLDKVHYFDPETEHVI
jgi:multiple sugar transport system ATP-binding protein